jgi:hypothetical protein
MVAGAATTGRPSACTRRGRDGTRWPSSRHAGRPRTTRPGSSSVRSSGPWTPSRSGQPRSSVPRSSPEKRGGSVGRSGSWASSTAGETTWIPRWWRTFWRRWSTPFSPGGTLPGRWSRVYHGARDRFSIPPPRPPTGSAACPPSFSRRTYRRPSWRTSWRGSLPWRLASGRVGTSAASGHGGRLGGGRPRLLDHVGDPHTCGHGARAGEPMALRSFSRRGAPSPSTWPGGPPAGPRAPPAWPG